MFIDIAFAEDNETDFLEMAARLGTEALCFSPGKRIVGTYSAGPKPRNADIVIIRSGPKDRDVMERMKPDIIYDLEYSTDADSLHFRSSGLNQVLCKIAKEKKVMVGISFSSLLAARDRPQAMGRIMQNIRLCRKYGVDMVIASFARDPYQLRAEKDLLALCHTLGMEPGQAKRAVNSVSERISYNKKRKDPDFIMDGLEIVHQ
ncbi:MAG: RNase P subunit p30 family protein [archaeon]